MDTAVFDNIPLFQPLSDTDRRRLLELFKVINIPAGTVIAREGEAGDAFYVILTGHVEVIKAIGSPEERLFSIRTTGDFIGEMSLLGKKTRRSATVRTKDDVAMLSMGRDEFDKMLEQWPKLSIEMLTEMSERLRSTERTTIDDLQQKNLELSHAYAELKAAQAQIIEKEKLERELQVARRIQNSFLPQRLPSYPGYLFGARILPARAVGGDLFDFIPLNHNRLGVLIADVSDKGVPAALFMALTRSLLRVEAPRSSSPKKLLQKVNQHISGMNEEGMFVTVLYGVLDLPSGQFDYARAGHELPILVDSSGRVYSPPMQPGQMLGVFDDPLIDEQTINLLAGSMLLLYTDGASDATDPNEVSIDREGLIQLFTEYSHSPAQLTADQLLQAIQHHQGNSSQFDDITLITLQATSD